jgi:hypothetical protein
MILYNFIKYLYLHIKYKKILQKIYENENLLNNLSYLFQSRFKQDWIGRVYTVLNPLIINDEVQVNTQILEYGVEGISNKSWIDKWIMDKLLIAQKFIKTNNLFDLLTYEIKQIDDYNYLFIMQPIVNLDLKKYTKRFIITYSIIIILLLILLIILL